MSMKISVAELSTFEPYAGLGGSDLLTADGSFQLKVKAAVTKILGDAKRETIVFTAVVQDEDNRGKQLVHNCVIGGVDKSGNSMIRNLGELLISLGKTKEEVRAYAAQGSLDLEQIAAAMVGKDVYARVEAEQYNNKGKIERNSKIDAMISPQSYKDAAATGAHRKPHGFSASAPTAGATPAAAAPAAAYQNGSAPVIPSINF